MPRPVREPRVQGQRVRQSGERARIQAGPVTGHPATTVAGGPGGWVGLEPHAIWVSADGMNTTITGSAGFTPQQVTAGSGGTGRFVVTGRDRQGLAVACTSTDNGATWAQSHGFGVVPSA
jgi:hypothetical protein